MPPFCRSRWVQPRTRRLRDVLQLRELDLELAFEAARALREDVEDEAVAVEHAPLDELLEVALLARATARGRRGSTSASLAAATALELLGLAAAHEVARIGARAAAGDGRHRLRAGGDAPAA